MILFKNLSVNGRLKMWVKLNLVYLFIVFYKEVCVNDKGVLDDLIILFIVNDVLVGLWWSMVCCVSCLVLGKLNILLMCSLIFCLFNKWLMICVVIRECLLKLKKLFFVVILVILSVEWNLVKMYFLIVEEFIVFNLSLDFVNVVCVLFEVGGLFDVNLMVEIWEDEVVEEGIVCLFIVVINCLSK